MKLHKLGINLIKRLEYLLTNISYFWQILGLFVVALLVYFPSLENGFIDWRDPEIILTNGLLSGISFSTIKTIFQFTANWIPITWLMHQIDILFFGYIPAGHHLMSNSIHALNTVLVFIIFMKCFSYNRHYEKDAHFVEFPRKNRVWVGVFVALLWALSPFRVEAVAWAAAKKILLSTCFLLLAVLSYFYHSHHTKQVTLFKSSYWRTFCLFVCACWSYQSALILPFLLIILDYYPFHRIQVFSSKKSTVSMFLSNSRFILEKIPYFLFSGLVLYLSYAGKTIHSVQIFWHDIAHKLGLGSLALVFYVKKTVFPFYIGPFYPPFIVDWHNPWVPMSVLVVTGTLLVTGLLIRRWPGPFVSIVSTITLEVPYIFFMTNDFTHADRWSYILSIPLYYLLGGVILWLMQHIGVLSLVRRLIYRLLAVLGLVILIVSVTSVYLQLNLWRSPETFWLSIIRQYPTQNAVAFLRMGDVRFKQGRYAESIGFYRFATGIDPKYVGAYNNMGKAFERLNRLRAAKESYDKAHAIEPKFDQSYINLGLLFRREKKMIDAKKMYYKALSIDSKNAKAYYNLAVINYFQEKNVPAMVQHLEQALANKEKLTKVQLADVYFFMGVGITSIGKVEKGQLFMEKAIQLNVRNAMYHETISRLLKQRAIMSNDLNFLKEAAIHDRLAKKYQ